MINLFHNRIKVILYFIVILKTTYLIQIDISEILKIRPSITTDFDMNGMKFISILIFQDI